MLKTSNEERANTLSHGLGIVFGAIALPFLPLGLDYIIYSLSFLLLFTSSTVYHAINNPKGKKIMQKIDHISIYAMIAGSYTPFIFACLKQDRAWIFFSIMWGIVVFGVVFKLYFTGKLEKLSLILYLGMGWMLVFIIKPFIAAFDATVIALVVLGGLFYTLGTYFYANDQRRYYHFVWHLFVLGGAVSHYFAILNIMK